MVYLELPSELTCHSKCECKLETRFPSLTLFFRSICHEPLQGYRHLWMCFLTLWCNEILQALADSSFLSGLCSMSSFWGLTPPLIQQNCSLQDLHRLHQRVSRDAGRTMKSPFRKHHLKRKPLLFWNGDKKVQAGTGRIPGVNSSTPRVLCPATLFRADTLISPTARCVGGWWLKRCIPHQELLSVTGKHFIKVMHLPREWPIADDLLIKAQTLCVSLGTALKASRAPWRISWGRISWGFSCSHCRSQLLPLPNHVFLTSSQCSFQELPPINLHAPLHSRGCCLGTQPKMVGTWIKLVS